MIVDPDFLDHWRTGMVVDALGDPMAPVYILRLWAHCQERKSDTFSMPTRGLKAQCKFPGDAAAFEAALIEAGFIERDGETVLVCGWAEKNASLLAAWANGNKGGRPKGIVKEPKQNPRVTQTEPTANPNQTHAEPIREDKRREEKKEDKTPSVSPRATKRCPEIFTVTDEMRAWAAEDSPGVDVDRETAKFKDHQFKTARSDWLAAWRSWIRRAFDSRPTTPVARGSPEPQWRTDQRRRMAIAVPGIADVQPTDCFDAEARNVTPLALGR